MLHGKKQSLERVKPIAYTLEKKFFAAATFSGMEIGFFRKK